LIVDYDDRDGGALIALTPSEVQALTRTLAHEAFPEFGDGRVVRDLVRGLLQVRPVRTAQTGNST
jgi:hypothetical protein